VIITKEMFDEFVESAENHSILWTDTLALIGVTVGDVPDVDVIEAQAAEIARLRDALGFYANLPCRLEFGVVNECPYDDGDTARAALAQETQP
jgi:hypothetical protein